MGEQLHRAFAPASVAAQHYEHALRSLSRRAAPGLSISVDVPFCAAKCLCCERVVEIAPPGSAVEDYVAGLVGELRLVQQQVGPGGDILQFHLGGGSANELGEAHVSALLRAVESCWRLPADAEMSIACDPRRVGPVQLGWLAALGFRHLTLGVLDLDPDVQRAVGRVQSPALVDDVCQTARECGFETVGVHLLVGLPNQTEASWKVTLEHIVAIGPNRVILGHYRHHPQDVPVQLMIDAAALPGAERGRAMTALANALLGEAGYRWLGPDQFVLDTDELATAFDQRRLHRNLIGWTATPAGPVIGVGAGARSEIDGSLFVNGGMPNWRDSIAQGGLACRVARLASQARDHGSFDLPLSCHAQGAPRCAW